MLEPTFEPFFECFFEFPIIFIPPPPQGTVYDAGKKSLKNRSRKRTNTPER
jgi:hypothetical protein